jgi:CyaY protein
MLDDATYEGLVATAFRRIMDAADELDPDVLDADSTGDMVTLTSAGGEKCVVNTQRAVQQIWVAGQGQGVHFDYDAHSSAWLDDKGRGIELLGFVSECVQALCGQPLAYQ